MARYQPRHAKTWWERQGYRKNHPVHNDGTEFYERSYAEEFEAEVEHEQGVAERGGYIPLTVAPTRTSNPGRPRTLAAGYDGQTDTLTVVFREGAQYEYYDVSSAEWQQFKRSASPGRFINRRFPGKDYLRIG